MLKRVFTCPFCHDIQSLANKAKHFSRMHKVPNPGRGKRSSSVLSTNGDQNPAHMKTRILSPPILPAAALAVQQTVTTTISQLSAPQREGAVDNNQHFDQILQSLIRIEAKLGELTSSQQPNQEQPARAIPDQHKYQDWSQVKEAIRRHDEFAKLSTHTLKNYNSVLMSLSEQGFIPENLATQDGIERMLRWAMQSSSKAKNILISAIKKASKVCYPTAQVSFPRCRFERGTRTCPSFAETVAKVQEMVDKKEIDLAMTSMFLLITGLRIGEAVNCPLDRFGESLCIKDFRQEKSRKSRPLVMLTREFNEFARRLRWTCISSDPSWINKRLMKYKLSCHTFRHAFISKRTERIADALASTSKVIGHSSPRVTEGYLIISEEKEREIMEESFTLGINIPQ